MAGSAKERDREHHERLFKASMSPVRRQIVATIGIQGKSREEVKKELNLNDFQMKFNLDWLITEGFVVEEDGKLKLTEDGIELLEAG
jgi:predicted transcriptional regulator